MTSQEVFDKVVEHLRKQGCKAISKVMGGCFFRTEDNLRCSIGCLIEANEYDPRMEGYVLFDLLAMHMDFVPASLKERLEPHKALLNRMMQIHDFVGVELWEAAFKGAAKEFNLTYTPPEKKEDKNV